MTSLYFEIRNTLKIRERHNFRLLIAPLFEFAQNQLSSPLLSLEIQMPEHIIGQGVQNYDNDVFIYIYERLFPKVEKYIQKNKGNSNIAQDIFQEIMIDILVKSKNGKLKGINSMESYIVACAINKWKKINSKKNKIKESLVEVDDDLTDEKYPIIDSLEPTGNFVTISEWLDELSESCNKLIKEFYFDKKSWNSIASDNGYQNARSASNQKYKCLESLRIKLKAKNFNL